MGTEHTKLFSCQYGSRLYGTSTPQSDIDWKHIVLPDFSSLLLGQSPKNMVKKTNTQENTKNGANDVDEEFIPLHVFARDFIGGQTYALELAHAIDFTEAGQVVHDTRMVAFARELRSQFLTANIKALVGYSVNQAKLYTARGERLNAIRAVLDVLRQFADLLRIDNVENEFEAEMRAVCEAYPKYVKLTTYARDREGIDMAPCIRLLERTLPYTSTFQYTIDQVERLEASYGDRSGDAAASGVDWKATMHALRIVNEGLKLLRGEGLQFPLPVDEVAELLAIKRGEREYTAVGREITEKLDLLQEIAANSILPTSSQELRADLELWLLGWLRRFYFGGVEPEAALDSFVSGGKDDDDGLDAERVEEYRKGHNGFELGMLEAASICGGVTSSPLRSPEIRMGALMCKRVIEDRTGMRRIERLKYGAEKES